MKLYEFQLPHYDNSGVTTVDAIRKFETELLAITGGFSRRPTVFGYRIDSRDSKRYEEPMTPYHVAGTPQEVARVLDLAWKLFPDQHAIFYAEVGEAHIMHKPAAKEEREIDRLTAKAETVTPLRISRENAERLANS